MSTKTAAPKKPRKTAPKKAKRSSAQKAATERMLAARAAKIKKQAKPARAPRVAKVAPQHPMPMVRIPCNDPLMHTELSANVNCKETTNRKGKRVKHCDRQRVVVSGCAAPSAAHPKRKRLFVVQKGTAFNVPDKTIRHDLRSSGRAPSKCLDYAARVAAGKSVPATAYDQCPSLSGGAIDTSFDFKANGHVQSAAIYDYWRGKTVEATDRDGNQIAFGRVGSVSIGRNPQRTSRSGALIPRTASDIPWVQLMVRDDARGTIAVDARKTRLRIVGEAKPNHHNSHHASGDPLGVYMPPLGQWEPHRDGHDWTHPALPLRFVTWHGFGPSRPWSGWVTRHPEDFSNNQLSAVFHGGSETEVRDHLARWYATHGDRYVSKRNGVHRAYPMPRMTFPKANEHSAATTDERKRAIPPRLPRHGTREDDAAAHMVWNNSYAYRTICNLEGNKFETTENEYRVTCSKCLKKMPPVPRNLLKWNGAPRYEPGFDPKRNARKSLAAGETYVGRAEDDLAGHRVAGDDYAGEVRDRAVGLDGHTRSHIVGGHILPRTQVAAGVRRQVQRYTPELPFEMRPVRTVRVGRAPSLVQGTALLGPGDLAARPAARPHVAPLGYGPGGFEEHRPRPAPRAPRDLTGLRAVRQQRAQVRDARRSGAQARAEARHAPPHTYAPIAAAQPSAADFLAMMESEFGAKPNRRRRAYA